MKEQYTDARVLNDVFKYTDVGQLLRRLSSKKASAAERGIEFDLNFDDLAMVGWKLLGVGACDYTGIKFSGSREDTFAPSIERIDHSKGYIRGNIAVVCNRANELKDKFIDRSETFQLEDGHMNRDDLRIVSLMMPLVTPEYLSGLKSKYVPPFKSLEEFKYMVDKDMIYDVVRKKDLLLPDADVVAPPVLPTPKNDKLTVGKKPEIEAPKVAEPDEDLLQQDGDEEVEVTVHPLPDDVEIAGSYAAMCKILSKEGIKIDLTFSQYKAIYVIKRCPFTGNELGDERYPVILDRSLPLEAGNLKMTTSVVGKAMNIVLDATGASVQDLAKNLKKLAG